MKRVGRCESRRKAKDPNALPEATMTYLDIMKHDLERKGIKSEDVRDIVQSAALCAVKARETYRAGKGANLATYLNRAAENGRAMYFRTKLALRRQIVTTTLDSPLGDGDGDFDGDPRTLLSSLPGECNRCEIEFFFSPEFENVFGYLTDEELDACYLLMKCFTKAEAAKLLGMSISQFKYKIMRALIRKFHRFYKDGGKNSLAVLWMYDK